MTLARQSAVAAAWALGVALTGLFVTELGPWYYALKQPPWKPPDAAFGPAWTTIFTLTAVAGVLAWRAEPDARARRVLLVAFAVNSVLNVLWSVLFFAWHRPLWALAEVVVLWASIAQLVLLARRSSWKAAVLLLPYLGWVSFAATLNLAVVRLNP